MRAGSRASIPYRRREAWQRGSCAPGLHGPRPPACRCSFDALLGNSLVRFVLRRLERIGDRRSVGRLWLARGAATTRRNDLAVWTETGERAHTGDTPRRVWRTGNRIRVDGNRGRGWAWAGLPCLGAPLGTGPADLGASLLLTPIAIVLSIVASFRARRDGFFGPPFLSTACSCWALCRSSANSVAGCG
jgi:hypothetical protein